MSNLIARTLRFADKSDGLLAAVSLLVFAVYAFYTVTFAFFTPYPGVEITAVPTGWQVNDSFQPTLEVNDIIVRIGDLHYTDYRRDHLTPLLAEYTTGEQVPVLLASGEETFLIIQHPNLRDIVRRFLFTLWFIPFWLAGSAVLLFLRPRDLTWRLLAAFMYLTAVWAMTGTISAWRISGVRLVLGIATWLMTPVVLHLHLLAPTPIFHRFRKYALPVLYAACILLAVAEFFQLPPDDGPLLTLSIAILISVTLLLYRAFWQASAPSDRLPIRLMLLGIALAFGPSLLLVVLPQALGTQFSNTVALTIALIAIPILPLFYIYAIYKRQLGNLEFRANRFLGLYGFAIVYPPIFLLVFLGGGQIISSASTRTVYYLFISTIFILGATPALALFQKFIIRLAYGAQHNPDEIIQLFADQIPAILQRDKLVELLQKNVTADLFIRQSALLVMENGAFHPWYANDVSEAERPSAGDMDALLQKPGQFLPDYLQIQPAWVLLAIPLQARGRLLGVWLFGRRDPDDYYPQQVINLLSTIANQTATIIENIRLYEALQTHADNLANEVASRTAELQAERDRTQAILDSAGEGIFFIDDRGSILYTNQSITRLTGFYEHEINGRSLQIWFSDKSAEENESLLAAIINGRAWSGELVLRRKNGTSFDAKMTLAPLRIKDGRFTGFVGVMSDISKTKEIDRLKSNLIAHVSHELKTPLTNINLYLSLLKQVEQSKKRDKYFNVLDNETAKLMQIIQDLLDLSRLESDASLTQMDAIDLVPIIDSVINANSRRVEKKDLTVQVDLPPKLPQVQGDKNQLEQLLTNLFVNAINYTPENGQISISAGDDSTQANLIFLSVSDTGLGIQPQEMPHLFERFYRGEISRQKNIPGSGLGLAICKEIIDRHNGKIDVISKVGAGTTFKIWLNKAAEK